MATYHNRRRGYILPSGVIKSGGRCIEFPLTRPRKQQRGRPLPRWGEAGVVAISSPLGGED